jgi:hypothetical protein
MLRIVSFFYFLGGLRRQVKSTLYGIFVAIDLGLIFALVFGLD